MNYKIKYEQIINKAKSLNRFKSNKIYYENHHILPKCLGGNDDFSNLVLLTAREHFLCHKLLYKENPKNTSLFRAYHCMSKCENSNQHRQLRISSREFSLIREEFAKIARKRMIENNPMKDPIIAKKCSNTQLRNGSNKGYNNGFYGHGDKFKGEGNPFYGKDHSKESKNKMSEAIIKSYELNPSLRIKSKEHKEKINGKNKTRYYIRKIQKVTNNSNIKNIAKYFKVNEGIIRSRLNDSPHNKEPSIEEMYTNIRKYKNHIKVYEDLKEI